MKFTDLMIDIETTGRRPGCAIIQIAAVPFNINTGEISKNTFKMSVNLDGQKSKNLELNSNTIGWWIKNNSKLFTELSQSKNSYYQVSSEFQKWFRSLKNNQDIRVWGNSNRFDLGILEGWYVKLIGDKFQPFWNTWNEKDVKTLVSLDPKIKINTKFIGVKHNALDDCKHQIKYCREIVKKYKLKIQNSESTNK